MDIVTTKVYDGKFLDMYVDTFIDGDKIRNWERCSRKNKTNAVMIVAKHINTNQYVMISEFRIPIKDREIGFPAGLIEPNESIEETVKREMKEETGLDVVEIKTISPLLYNTSGLTDEGCYIAYVNVDGNISNQYLEQNEDIYTLIVSKEDIKTMLANKNNKWGAKAWIICNNIINN